MKLTPVLPFWILAIIFAPIVAWLTWKTIQQVRKKARTSWTRYVRMLVIVLCLGVVALGPSLPGDKAPAGVINLDVVIVADRTASVSAEDYDGQKPRLDGMKHDMLALVDSLKGARIALVTFDSTAKVNVPFTSDSSALATAINVMDQEISTYSKGSSIDMPLDVTTTLFNKSKQTYPDRGRLFFYLSDGEQTSKTDPKSFAALKPLVNGGAVLGYGTTEGGKMKTYYGYQDSTFEPSQKYIQDLTTYGSSGFADAISKINEPNLQQIASETGTKYIHRTSLTQPVSEIVAASNLQVVADNHREILHYVSLYWIFAFAVAILLGWWLLDLMSVLRVGLQKKGAAS